MDLPTLLYALSGALDIGADDLLSLREELLAARQDMPDGEGFAEAWGILGQCCNRLDVHSRSLKALAERCRRRSEGLSRPASKGPLR